MPRSTPAPNPAQLAQLRAETEAVRDRIWARWQSWSLQLLLEERTGARSC